MRRISTTDEEYEADDFVEVENDNNIETIDNLLQNNGQQMVIAEDSDGNLSISIVSYTHRDRVIEDFIHGHDEDGWTRRTVQSLSRETQLTEAEVQAVLDGSDSFTSSPGSRGRVYWEHVD